jgi:hypothetical protein
MGATTSAEGIPVISSNRAISLVLCPATEDTSFGVPVLQLPQRARASPMRNHLSC